MHLTFTLAAWVHDLSPFVVRFGDQWGIRWYGVSYALGFLIGWLILRWLSKRGVTPLSPERLGDAMVLLVAGVIVGGRLGYVLIYEPHLLVGFDNVFPWWGLLKINRGGMAFHGAAVGVMAASLVIARQCVGLAGLDRPVAAWRHVMDLVAIACTPGLALGRLANFVNGELLGKVVAGPGEKAAGWSVRYPQEIGTTQAPLLTPDEHEALVSIIERYALPGDPEGMGTERMLRVLQSGSEQASAQVASAIEPFLSARHPSQLYQAFFEGVLLTAVLWWVWRKPRAAGVVGCWFLVCYGVLRVVAEFWRLPDAQFVVGRPLGLSRGQWLSVGMIVAGAGIMAWCRKREPVLGGWARREKA